MHTLFIAIYDLFRRKKGLMYLSLAFFFALFAFFAFHLRFEEDIMRFMPSSAGTENVRTVFQNLKVKDKLIVLFGNENGETEQLNVVADSFAARLMQCVGGSYASSVVSDVSASGMSDFSSLIYNHLPVFLNDSDYLRMDSLLTAKGVSQQLEKNYFSLMMPSSLFTKDFILRDPLSLGSNQLRNLQNLKLDGNYQVADNHIYTSDGHLLVFVSPSYPASNTAANAVLVDSVEHLIDQCKLQNPEVQIDYFGGPAVAVYNARQIRQDIQLTMGVAILVVVIVILLSFRNRLSFLLIFIPVIFGTLFSLALLYFIKGTISIIAVGAGSAVLGVVLSYSIHVVAHREHTSDIRQLITEMSEPLTIGSFTTIGAFFSLVFTSSEVLQDFGWFSSLTIVGTTLFCLIFLPHLLVLDNNEQNNSEPKPLLKFIEKINNFHYDKCKWLVLAVFILSLGGFLLSNRVEFDSDMNNLGYMDKKFVHAQNMLDSAFQGDYTNIYFVSVGKNFDEATSNYMNMNAKLESLRTSGLVHQVASAQSLLIPLAEQQQRINRWNEFWTDSRKQTLSALMSQFAPQYGFSVEVVDNCMTMVNKDYQPVNYTANSVLSDFITTEDSVVMEMSQVSIPSGSKNLVYDNLQDLPGVVILDKPHFMSKFMSSISDDFYFVLFVSSFIVFLALLISYGRLELALMTFLPMALGWFIILGVMALFGLKFNIVSIIISTFIFGTGDDFSIFVSDGLLTEYRTGKPMLGSHKTAIFFSSFTTIVGMGALFFAKHPSLLSVAQTSVIGMLAVVLIAYTIQPFLFRLFITGRTSKGKAPWTFVRFFAWLITEGCFFFHAVLMMLLAPVIWLLPLPRKTVRLFLHYIVQWACKLTLLFSYWKTVGKGSMPEKPSVLIANHSSALDLVQLLSWSPKIVVMVKTGIWKSPLFGFLVRSLGFYPADGGYVEAIDPLRKMIAEGYSILVFPEGTRSQQGELARFHKGAFYLAEQLQLDVVPVVLTGHWHGIAKGDLPFLCPALFTYEICDPVKFDDKSWGETYQERRTSVSKMFRKEYENRLALYDTADDRYYVNHLIQNYIYKGPVLEWYLRVKVHLEHGYKVFDELIPKSATITDIGCGYGFLCYMLSFLSKSRVIRGIDYDEEKIAVANHCFSKNENISFDCCNASNATLHHSDVFIMNDMLHYMPYERQNELITNCMNLLNEKGVIIIRDGNSNDTAHHRMTKLSEIFSTKITRFNKTEGVLHFTSAERIEQIASENGFSVQIIRDSDSTSNEIFVLRKFV